MGAADVVPGVSGGTIAFITGIYEKLIRSLNEIDLTAFKYLFTLRFKLLMDKINGWFLLSLLFGVFISVLSLAKGILYLLQNHPISLWSFFFGLIVASAIVVAKKIKAPFALKNIAGLLAGILLAYFISSSGIIRTPNTLPYIFGSGIIAIIAMILPGISGSYLLVILDKYQYIIEIISGISTGLKGILLSIVAGDMPAAMTFWNEMELLPILIFEAGTLTGIIGFSKVLYWLLKKHHDITIAVLTGIMIGSLQKVWPWKQTLETYIDRHGEIKPLIEQNVLPQEFGAHFYLAVGLAILGFIIVYLLEKFGPKEV